MMRCCSRQIAPFFRRSTNVEEDRTHRDKRPSKTVKIDRSTRSMDDSGADRKGRARNSSTEQGYKSEESLCTVGCSSSNRKAHSNRSREVGAPLHGSLVENGVLRTPRIATLRAFVGTQRNVSSRRLPTRPTKEITTTRKNR